MTQSTITLPTLKPLVELKSAFANCLKEFKSDFRGDPYFLLKKINNEEVWRFFVDGRDQEKSGVKALSQYEAEKMAISLLAATHCASY